MWNVQTLLGVNFVLVEMHSDVNQETWVSELFAHTRACRAGPQLAIWCWCCHDKLRCWVIIRSWPKAVHITAIAAQQHEQLDMPWRRGVASKSVTSVWHMIDVMLLCHTHTVRTVVQIAVRALWFSSESSYSKKLLTGPVTAGGVDSRNDGQAQCGYRWGQIARLMTRHSRQYQHVSSPINWPIIQLRAVNYCRNIATLRAAAAAGDRTRNHCSSHTYVPKSYKRPHCSHIKLQIFVSAAASINNGYEFSQAFVSNRCLPGVSWLTCLPNYSLDCMLIIWESFGQHRSLCSCSFPLR